MSDGASLGQASSPQKQENLRSGLGLGNEVKEAEKDAGADEDSGISLEQILELKERFDNADQDGGGSLDMQEFMEAFGSIINRDGSMTQDQIARLFMQIDANSDGGIDWNEFSTYMLMESQSSGKIGAKWGIGTFYMSDVASKRLLDPDWFHREPADCALIDTIGAQYITASKDGMMRMWTASSLQLSRTINCGHSWILALCFLRKSGRLVMSTADRRIRFWDMHTWEEVASVELQSPALCLCSWLHGDAEMFAMGNEKGEVTVVDISKGLREPKVSGKERKPKKRPDYWAESVTKRVHRGWIEQIAMVEDLGGLVTCGADSAIVIFEYPFQCDPKDKDSIIPRRILKHSRGHLKGVKCFQWVKSHKLVVSGGLERDIVVWNPYTCKPVTNMQGHTSGISQITINPEFEQVISLAIDGITKVWDLRTHECVQTISFGENVREKGAKNATIIYDSPRHRLITVGLCPHIWKVNPQILKTSTDVTHMTPVVAALYNRNFGHIVTVAEDSEVTIWKFLSGQKVFNYVDNTRDEETFLSAASFDDNGRRLITGDHGGRVKVWNFSNGACIKTLVKPTDPFRRQEVTGLTMYQYEDTRFFAASSWDRKISVWVDDSGDSGNVDPFMQIGGNDDDVLGIAFTYPKALVTGGSDGNIHMFDVESGARRFTMACTKPQSSTGNTPRTKGSAAAELTNTQYVEKVIFLEERNKTLVSVGGDGHLRFWEGVWMETVPASCNAGMATFKLALIMKSGHWPEFGLVDVRVDEANCIMCTADEGGFVKMWDISAYDWQNPRAEQIVSKYFWRAHPLSITTVDLITPPPEVREREVLVLTASADRRVLLWTQDGVLIGQFGKAKDWDVNDRSTWAASSSADIMHDILAGVMSAMNNKEEEEDDSEEERDILLELDERLRKKPSSSVQFKVSPLKAMPPEIPSRKGKKGRDYEVDILTGERVYKNPIPKKSQVGEEKLRPPMTQYLKHFVKKLDPENVVPAPGGDAPRDARVGTPKDKQ